MKGERLSTQSRQHAAGRRASAFRRGPVLGALALTVWFTGAHAAPAGAPLSGEALYKRTGCIACHQAGGKGSDIAPMLPGHTAQQVKRYVRNPIGKMPRFGYDKLSDSELDAIATYIAGLPMPHMMSGVSSAAEELEMHHWMAYRSLMDGDYSHAEHHLMHAMEVAASDAHRRDLERALALAQLKRGKMAAQHVLEIASATSAPDLTVAQMHLKLAVGALEAGDTEEGEHHIGHFLDGASAHDRKHALAALTELRRGNLASAKKKLAHMMAK